MNRSTALLKSLSAERERWEKTSETFKNQMSTIAGDCLLSAAFIAYAGYFDQQMRQNLFTTWSHHLQQANIQVTVCRDAQEGGARVRVGGLSVASPEATPSAPLSVPHRHRKDRVPLQRRRASPLAGQLPPRGRPVHRKRHHAEEVQQVTCACVAGDGERPVGRAPMSLGRGEQKAGSGPARLPLTVGCAWFPSLLCWDCPH